MGKKLNPGLLADASMVQRVTECPVACAIGNVDHVAEVARLVRMGAIGEWGRATEHVRTMGAGTVGSSDSYGGAGYKGKELTLSSGVVFNVCAIVDTEVDVELYSMVEVLESVDSAATFSGTQVVKWGGKQHEIGCGHPEAVLNLSHPHGAVEIEVNVVP
jgi:hypothetical protein